MQVERLEDRVQVLARRCRSRSRSTACRCGRSRGGRSRRRGSRRPRSAGTCLRPGGAGEGPAVDQDDGATGAAGVLDVQVDVLEEASVDGDLVPSAMRLCFRIRAARVPRRIVGPRRPQRRSTGTRGRASADAWAPGRAPGAPLSQPSGPPCISSVICPESTVASASAEDPRSRRRRGRGRRAARPATPAAARSRCCLAATPPAPAGTALRALSRTSAAPCRAPPPAPPGRRPRLQQPDQQRERAALQQQRDRGDAEGDEHEQGPLRAARRRRPAIVCAAATVTAPRMPAHTTPRPPSAQREAAR